MYLNGMNLCLIADQLGIHHDTASIRVGTDAACLPDVPMPQEVKVSEMDGLFTFTGNKKQDLHPDDRRPANALLYRLKSGLGVH
jgi:hypothetical protein